MRISRSRANSAVAAAIFLALLFFPEETFSAFSSDEAYLKAAVRIAVVEVVLTEPDRAHTYLNPPKLKLKILRMIRGDINGKEIPVIWSAPVPFDMGNKVELRKWYQEIGSQPYPPPENGSRWIVILTGPSLRGDYYADVRCRYFYSRETFDWVTSVIPEYLSRKKEGEEELL
jgi:hypothetical protein